MKSARIGIAITIALVGPSADAALLSIQFAGGGAEVTLAQGQSATIEVVFTGDEWDSKSPITETDVSGTDLRFDVGTLATGVGGSYVLDGPTDFLVTNVLPGNFQNWQSHSLHFLYFNCSFFLAAGDPSGVSGPAVGPGVSVVLASFIIQKYTLSMGDTHVVFNVDDHAQYLPALYLGTQAWVHRWQYPSIEGPRQFELGTGNPGDADPRFWYHGYETLQPLIIHQVPEPGALALLALGALVLLRRRAPNLKPWPDRISSHRWNTKHPAIANCSPGCSASCGR